MEFCNRSFIESDYFVSETQLNLIWSSVVSIFLMGAMIGSCLSAVMADSLGRKTSISITSLLALGASLFFLSAKPLSSVICLLMGRFISGIQCGIASTLIPMYLMEISPKDYQNSMGVMHTLGMVIGLLISQILGQESIYGNSTDWPFLMMFYSFFIFVGFGFFFNSPESPNFLLIQLGDEIQALKGQYITRDHNDHVAIKNYQTIITSDNDHLHDSIQSNLFLSSALESLYGPQNHHRQSSLSSGKNSIVINSGLMDLKSERKKMESESKWTLMKIIKSKQLRRPLLIMISLHVGQQFSGINAVFYYSTKIFESVGLTPGQSQIGSIATGSLNVFMTLLSVHLLNKFSSKSLMLFSSISAIIMMISLTVSISLQVC